MIDKNNKGLTLVEVVIAMALVVMIVSMSIPIFVTTGKIIARSSAKTTSTYGSLSEIEKIKSWSMSHTILNLDDLANKLKANGYVEEGGANKLKRSEGNIEYTVKFVMVDGKNTVHLISEKNGSIINEFYYILFFPNK